MKKNLIILFGLLISSQNALARCESWKVEITNQNTNEVKTYIFQVGSKSKLDLPKMKNYDCIFEISEANNGKTAAVQCIHRYGKSSFSMTSSVASCGLTGAPQTGSLLIYDRYDNRRSGYSFLFGPTEVW